MRFSLLIFVALFACDEDDIQPNILKVDNGLYEVRYGRDTNLEDIAKTLCGDRTFTSAPIGERHDVVTGNTILVGTVRCSEHKRHD